MSEPRLWISYNSVVHRTDGTCEAMRKFSFNPASPWGGDRPCGRCLPGGWTAYLAAFAPTTEESTHA